MEVSEGKGMQDKERKGKKRDENISEGKGNKLKRSEHKRY